MNVPPVAATDAATANAEVEDLAKLLEETCLEKEEQDPDVDQITELVQNRLSLNSSMEAVGGVLEYLPGVELVDLPFRMLLWVISCIAGVVYKPLPLSEETFLTLKQKERIQDLANKKKELEGVKDCATLCRLTATLVDETIPLVVADILQGVPPLAEQTALFCLEMCFPFFQRVGIKYINRQVQNRAHLRDAIIHSVSVQALGRVYSSLSARCAVAMVRKPLTSPWVDFEHIVWTLCSRFQEVQSDMLEDLKRVKPGELKTPKNVGLVLKALATVMSKQPAIDKSIKEKRIQGEAESFIARLQWHKENGSLPPGVPDPTVVSLTPENLSHELREALMKHMASVAEMLLDKYAPKSMRYSWLYWLEGKELLISIFSSMAVELGVEQLVKPHELAILILSNAGYKTTQAELDKLGPNTHDAIHKTGQKMIKESLKPKPDSESILRDFTQSELRVAPGGVGAVEQRRDTRELLTRHVSGMIEKYLAGTSVNRKAEPATQNSGYAVSAIANVVLGVLISAGMHGYKVLTGEATAGETLATAVQGGVAKQVDFLDQLANQIVSLIYHPSWRITVLSLIDAVLKSVTTPDHKKQISERECKIYFQIVTKFLYGHLSPVLLAKCANALTGDTAYEKFQQAVQPTGESLLNTGIPKVLPIVKERILYSRVTQWFRGLGATVPGDVKFWETYVREYLDDIESFSLSDGYTPFLITQAEERSTIRARVVDAFVELSPVELLKKLNAPPDTHREIARGKKQEDVPVAQTRSSNVEGAKPPDAQPQTLPPQTAVRKSPAPPATALPKVNDKKQDEVPVAQTQSPHVEGAKPQDAQPQGLPPQAAVQNSPAPPATSLPIASDKKQDEVPVAQTQSPNVEGAKPPDAQPLGLPPQAAVQKSSAPPATPLPIASDKKQEKVPAAQTQSPNVKGAKPPDAQRQGLPPQAAVQKSSAPPTTPLVKDEHFLRVTELPPPVPGTKQTFAGREMVVQSDYELSTKK